MQERLKQLWTNRPAWLRGRGLYWAGGAVALVVVLFMIFGNKSDAEPYRTAKIDRGAVTRVVSATGTLQPLVSANVGSTVSGPVQSVEVDFNSQVREGQVLARLDPTSFQQRVTQAQAQLAQAQAQAAVANADYARYQTLNAAGFASQQLMVQQRAARDTARASVQTASAQLASARTDLDRSVIRSPITGVVVDKQVSVGQSVAASFQAATLFVIAQDLSRLQANITVDEADIGDVRQGQQVRFTVDAFPDREFDGVVSQVRQQGASDQGVVSYTVVVEADNPGRQLLPGMTANADIIIEQQNNVVRVPNGALRFRPADPALAAQAQAMTGDGGARSGRGDRGQNAQAQGGQGGRGEGGQNRAGRGVAQLTQALELNEAQQATVRQAFTTAMDAARAQAGGGGGRGGMRAAMRQVREQAIAAIQPSLSPRQQQLLTQMRANGGLRDQSRDAVVWVLRNNRPAPVRVQVGSADNGYTVLVGGELKEGDEVITGGGPQNTQAQQGGSPFGGGGPGGPGGGGGGVRIRGA